MPPPKRRKPNESLPISQTTVSYDDDYMSDTFLSSGQLAPRESKADDNAITCIGDKMSAARSKGMSVEIGAENVGIEKIFCF